MSIDENIVHLLLQKKKRRPTKVEQVMVYRDEILELRKRGLSLADICAYLEAKHNLSVSPETLKKAVPELKDKVKRAINVLSSLSCSELQEVVKFVKKRIEECKGGNSSE